MLLFSPNLCYHQYRLYMKVFTYMKPEYNHLYLDKCMKSDFTKIYL